MKRVVLAYTLAVTLISLFALQSFAIKETDDYSKSLITKSTYEYFSDGSYLEITLTESEISLLASSTKSGSKTVNYYNNKNVIMWSATVNGTFCYDGVKSTCVNSNVSYKIYDDSWKNDTSASSKNSNQAIGDFIFKRYFSGIAIKTVSKSVVISCSNTGVLS